MILLYGFGEYAKDLFQEYDVPWSEIGVIVDQAQRVLEKDALAGEFHSLGNTKAVLDRHQELDDSEKIQTISWDDFIKDRKVFDVEYAIIGTTLYEKEVRKKLLDSGVFSEEKVLLIDDWITQFPKTHRGGAAKKLVRLMKEAGEIENDLLVDAKVVANREFVLKELPKGMIAAEIGVAYGAFSEKILDTMQPKKFFAIDMFDESIKGFWGNDAFSKANMTHLEWYRTKFKEEIDQGIVETRKGLSCECLSQFPDDYFDYIYLDAGHDYDNVKKDVEEIKRVIKPKGLIQFNDYIFFDYMGEEFYGVMPVVNRLVNETKSKVLYYCLSLSGFDDIVVEFNK